MTRRVFLIWTHPIFYESMRLVLAHPEIALVGAGDDYQAAALAIQELEPDIVLVEEGTQGAVEEVANILQTCPPSMQLIGLNISNNYLNIYRRRQATITEPGDLLSLLLQETT